MADEEEKNGFMRPLYKEDGLYIVLPMGYEFLEDTQGIFAGDMVEIYADIIKRDLIKNIPEYAKEHLARKKKKKETDD